MERLRETWRVTHVVDEEAKHLAIKDLVHVAKALGVPFAGGASLRVKINNTPVSLWLEVDHETNEAGALHLSVRLESNHIDPEAPSIILRREEPNDVRDKRQGLTREVQLGTEFDDAVYIDSDAEDLEVKRILSRPAAQEAVQWLLEGGVPSVTINQRRVEIRLGSPHNTERVLRALEAVLIIAKAGGPRGKRTVPRGTRLLRRGLVTLLFAAMGLVWALTVWNAGFWFPTIAFALTGTVMTIITIPVLRRLVSGDSGAGARARLLTPLVWLTTGALGATVLLGANALLGEEANVQRAEVLEVRQHVDGTYWTLVRWESGRTGNLDVPHKSHMGAKLTKTTHRGLFDVMWGETITVE